MKSIFVPVMGVESDHAALEAARTLAGRVGAAVRCMHVRLDSNSALALATHETSWRAEREENERSAKARGEFDRVFGPQASGAAAKAGADAHWREIEGFPLYEHAWHGRMHDLVVVARERRLPEHCAEMIMRTGRPIVIAPPKPAKTIGETVLVAWNNSPESARALTASMPILDKAKKVLLACIPTPLSDEEQNLQSLEELRGVLRLHGIEAEARLLSKADGREADLLRTAAYDADCDLIVMGAYGHTRLREYVFGGVTREMLKDCVVPVLMFH